MRRKCLVTRRLWMYFLMAAGVGFPVHAAEVVTTPFLGITLRQRTETTPRPLKINVLEIDLGAPGLSFRVTPSNGPEPLETTLQTTRDFMNQQGAQLAVNGSFFGGTVGNNTDNNGLAASDGNAYSPFDSGYHALNIQANNVATIVQQASPDFTGFTPNPLVPIYNAVAGNRRLVLNGVNNITAPNSFDTALRARTAAGLGPDNRLFLMTVDEGVAASQGVTTSELADLLIGYGVTQGLNLDGGGSTAMTMQGAPNSLINNPSDGDGRAVGTNLAIFAAPIPEPMSGTLLLLVSGLGLSRPRRRAAA